MKLRECLCVTTLSYYEHSRRATSLLVSSDVGATLSSGLYIVKANATDLSDERHYVIYWPEDSTWNDSATSSVRRNRVTFMR